MAADGRFFGTDQQVGAASGDAAGASGARGARDYRGLIRRGPMTEQGQHDRWQDAQGYGEQGHHGYGQHDPRWEDAEGDDPEPYPQDYVRWAEHGPGPAASHYHDDEADWQAGAEPAPAQGMAGHLADRIRRRAQQAVNGAGALTSLALVIGLGVWGYKLAMRDVTGIPVIAAIEGPARVAPENPGGELAQHRGLAVNTVAAVGEAAETADRLTLAPQPVALTDEDLPMAELGSALPPATGPLAPVEGPTQLAAQKVPPEPLPDDPAEPILDAALAEAPVVEGIEGALAVAMATIPADVPGVARSLRPQPRPQGDLPDALAMAAAEPVMASYTDVDPATLAAGARLVQLGAFDTEAEARGEWDRLALEFGSLLQGKGRVIQPAESAGRAFFRLRASGFADLADARRFCAALVDQDAHCIPVQAR